MSVSPVLDIHSVLTHMTVNTISLPILIKKSESKSVKTLALIDSRAWGKFINQKYAKQLGLPIQPLRKPIMAWNIDGTLNKTGTITSFVDLSVEIDGRTMDLQLLVTGLGSQRIILGFPWLNEHNPDINWKTGEFKWRTHWPLKVKRYHDKLVLQEERPACPIRMVKMDNNLEVKLHSDMAWIPTWGSPNAAGYDLYSAEDKIPSPWEDDHWHTNINPPHMDVSLLEVDWLPKTWSPQEPESLTWTTEEYCLFCCLINQTKT